MGFPDVTSTLDKASQMLAGGSSTPTAALPPTQAVFARGVHLDEEDPNYSGATSPNLLNEKDASVLLEFIHFGNVHTTYANFFVHSTSFKDNEKDDKFTPSLRPRAIQFRSALEREAVLLSVFMECTQTVLQERADSKGALGTAMDTLGSMIGAGGGGSGQTTPGEVNPHLQKVSGAIKPVLGESITYPSVHQAGRDMHQARTDYRTLLAKIDKEKPSSDAGSSLTSGLLKSVSSGLGGVGGTIGDVINFAQALAFKPQDVKVKFYIKVAIQQEAQIETACHDMTLKAIKAAQNPVLPVWFGDPNAQGTPPETWDGSQAPQNPIQHEDDRSNLLRKPVNMVADPLAQFRSDRVKDANKIKDFFENPTPPDPPPGTDSLDEAFKVAEKPLGKQDPMPMEMGALAVQAFIEALGLPTPLNSFCEGIISAVLAVTLDFMHGVYEALLLRSPEDTITDAALYQAAQDHMQLTQRLLALASDKVSFIQKARDFKTPEEFGYSVGVGQIIDKRAGDVETMIQEKIGPVVDKALELAMGGLAAQLELGRLDSVGNKCGTMEWYLGRLPWVTATLFWNLFFPFWNALLKVMTDVVDPHIASVLKQISSVTDSAAKTLNAARDDIAEAKALNKAFTDGLSTDKQSRDRLNQALGTRATSTSAPNAPERGAFTVPVTGRSVTGKGVDVDLDTYNQVKPEFKWDGADSPDSDPAKKDGDKPADAAAPATPAGQ